MYRHSVGGATVEFKSANVFVDDLHGSGSLSTTYYVTDSKQQTDFFWYRKSGIVAALFRGLILEDSEQFFSYFFFNFL